MGIWKAAVKHNRIHCLCGCGLFGCALLVVSSAAHGQINSWKTSGSGSWQSTGNWSLGVAPASNQMVFVTNTTTKTVTIDLATTTNAGGSTMTISNLTVSGPVNNTNTLFLNNAGTNTPLRLLNTASLSTRGMIIITNSVLRIDGPVSPALSIFNGGVMQVNNGTLAVTNTGATIDVGNVGSGSLTVQNGGVLNAATVDVGRFAGANGSLALASGTSTLSSNLTVGDQAGATGAVWMTGGQLVVTNANASAFVGNSGIGQMTVSNGTVLSTLIRVGNLSGSRGTLTMTVPGGTVSVSSNLLVGASSNVVGTVIVAGGALYVTNAAHSAVTEVRNGTLTLNTGGVFVTDSLVITNANGSFINNGGTFTVTGQAQIDQGTQTFASGTSVLSSNLVVGSTANSTGTVNVTGTLVITNGVLSIGNDGTITSGGGVGQMNVSSTGTLEAITILLGSSAGGQGDLTLGDGGIIRCAGTNCLIVINSDCWCLIGGSLVWSNANSILECGVTAPGDFDPSDGTHYLQELFIGYSDVGTMTMSGSTMDIASKFIVGHIGPQTPAAVVSTGTVWITGGQLTITNPSGSCIIGNSGVGQMTMSNGMVTAADVIVGNSSNPGTLTLAGGTLTANGIVLTNPSSRFIFSGGQLNTKAITNANGQVLTVGNGIALATLNLLGGTSSLGNGLNISANATLMGFGTINGTVVNNGAIASVGGTLIFNSLVTNNGVIITNGISFLGGLAGNGRLLDAAGDADSDGMNNLWEVLAGTSPINNASVFHITAVTKLGNDVQVKWSTVGGKSYVVQASTGTGGNFSANFADLSLTISVPGIGESITNYLDPGGATYIPSRYYRVRLAP